jgi:hypothetical protein
VYLSNGSEVLDALTRTKALLSLELQTGGRPFHLPPHLPSVTSTLTKLTFHVEWDTQEYVAMKAFFDNVTLPSLNTLEIKNQLPDSPVPPSDIGWPVEAFGSLIERSRCELRKLKILHIPMSDGTLISILECVSETMEELIIKEPTKWCFSSGNNDPSYTSSSITDRLVERLHLGVSTKALALTEHDRDQDSLITSSVGGALLPALRHLELSCIGKPCDLSLIKFLKMIQSRCRRESTFVDSGAASAPSKLSLTVILIYVSVHPSDELEEVNRKLEEDMSLKPPVGLGVDIKIIQQSYS